MIKRSHLILFIGGALVAAGMTTSYFGAKLVTEDLSIAEGLATQGSPVELTKELDPTIRDVGVYVVRVEGFDGVLQATLFDPSGLTVTTKEISSKSTEEEFKIDLKGTYRLLLENPGSGEAPVVIGLTHMPDKNLLALNIFGQSIIISGLIGLGLAVAYEIRNRRKKSS